MSRFRPGGLILLLGFTAATGGPRPAVGADLVRYVVADGEGANREEAQRVALARAVRQAVGAYVASEQKLLDNGDAVREIVEFSNAYITWYAPLDLPDAKDGKKRLRVSAEVAAAKLEAKLERLGLWRPVQGDPAGVDYKPLYAATVSEQLRKENAKKLLTLLLKQAPTEAEAVRRVAVLPVDVAELKKGSDEKGDASQVWSLYGQVARFQVEHDLGRVVAYNRWLDSCLQHAKFGDRAERTFQSVLKPDTEVKDRHPWPTEWREYRSLRYETPRASRPPYLPIQNEGTHPLSRIKANQAALALLTGYVANATAARTTWAVYTLPKDVCEAVASDLKKVVTERTTVTLRAVDGNGSTRSKVEAYEFQGPLFRGSEFSVHLSRDQFYGSVEYGHRKLYHIDPFILEDRQYSPQFEFTELKSVGRKVFLQFESLPAIRKYEATLSPPR